MEKLPKVYVNPINHNIENAQQSYKSNMRGISLNNKHISTNDVDKILNSKKHIYRSRVRLQIDNENFEKVIVSRNNDFLITIDNEKIPIKSINSIEEI